MKRLLIFACSFFLTLFSALSAGAEIVGRTAEGDFIHRYLASNGQELFFVSMEREPPVNREDVNGDGVDDLVVYTAIGASNYFVEFFVWDGEKYVMAQHGGRRADQLLRLGFRLCSFLRQKRLGRRAV